MRSEEELRVEASNFYSSYKQVFGEDCPTPKILELIEELVRDRRKAFLLQKEGHLCSLDLVGFQNAMRVPPAPQVIEPVKPIKVEVEKASLAVGRKGNRARL